MPFASFGLTYDYRCPFARIAAHHVIAGLRAGVDWEVEWIPFSLGQAHVPEDGTPVWDQPERDSGLLAQQVAVAVAELAPDRFLDVHADLFDLRHVHGKSLVDCDAIAAILQGSGVETEPVWEAIVDGGTIDTVRKAHEAVVANHDVWGVPTFIVEDRAAFVRLMDMPADAASAQRTVERVLDMVAGWPELNELKHTTLDR